MSRVAIVTDSASDLSPETAAANGIDIVPLVVNFGGQTFKAGVDLSTAEFWRRMTAPEAPFPTTAASAPGDFKAAYDRCFAEGADAIVSIHVAGTLSGTIKSAEIARGLVRAGEVHVIDSGSASMGEGLLALLAARLAKGGTDASEIAAAVEDRKADLDLYVALDTLDYLKKGGRISGAQAAIGTLLSVKPIITIRDGLVHTADKPRTRGKARERVLELLTARPIERLAVLYTPPADGEAFRREVLERLAGKLHPDDVSVQIVGPSVGPHLGPGCVGGVVLYAR
ncbi:MAG: DegV family protein [Chloroflexota bacterium]|nr:DegV family protein [Chloroflexota bacterium]